MSEEVKEKKIKERSEIPDEYKWDLSLIYANKEAWEADFAAVDPLVKKACALRGTLGDPSGAPLLEYLKISREITALVSRLSHYARMMSDQNCDDSAASELRDRSSSLSTEVDSSLSWVNPEILAIPDDVLAKIRELEAIRPYNRMLDMVLHAKPHTLTPEQEKIISLAFDFASLPEKAFFALEAADLVFPVIEAEKGERVQITQGNYIDLLRSKDRRVRKDAFTSYYGEYVKYGNTFANLLEMQIKALIFNARARKYKSTMEAALDSDVISVDVYKSLVQEVNNSFDVFYKYVALRKKCLGLEKLDMYDQYVSLVPGDTRKYTYQEGCDMVLAALRPMGEEYCAMVKKALTSRWIDVYESKGKASGAYSGGGHDVPPFILLNYTGSLDSVFALAHEMGHSMHTLFSVKGQPFEYSEYSIFVAEVASTVNECLLYYYLMDKAVRENDKQMQTTLLNEHCDNFKGTLFRQVMFAEFEMRLHELVETTGASSKDAICDLYYDINKKYYGPDVDADKLISYEWCRISHFFLNFYVYVYATSFCIALVVGQKIYEGDQDMVKRHIQFLSAGCSMDPLDIIRTHLGIDMTKPDCVREAVKDFDVSISKLSELLTSH